MEMENYEHERAKQYAATTTGRTVDGFGKRKLLFHSDLLALLDTPRANRVLIGSLFYVNTTDTECKILLLRDGTKGGPEYLFNSSDSFGSLGATKLPINLDLKWAAFNKIETDPANGLRFEGWDFELDGPEVQTH